MGERVRRWAFTIGAAVVGVAVAIAVFPLLLPLLGQLLGSVAALVVGILVARWLRPSASGPSPA